MLETDKEARIRLAEEALILQGKLDYLKQLFREINYEPYRADVWMMKEARNTLDDSEFKEKGDDT